MARGTLRRPTRRRKFGMRPEDKATTATRARSRKSEPPPPNMEWAWFFDIDGTLVEIADSPDAIVVHDEMPQLLGRLNTLASGAVALVTGRAILDVDRHMDLTDLTIAGQHGLELRIASGETFAHQVEDENLNRARSKLVDAVSRHEGLILEDKGLTIALHYRDAPRLAGYAHRLMRNLREQYLPDFMVQGGKRLVELKPSAKDKGIAILELLRRPPFAGRIPIFIGDDVTDELGFKALNRVGGHSIKIGPGRTSARWRIKDVTSLREWLRAGIDAATESMAVAGA